MPHCARDARAAQVQRRHSHCPNQRRAIQFKLCDTRSSLDLAPNPRVHGAREMTNVSGFGGGPDGFGIAPQATAAAYPSCAVRTSACQEAKRKSDTWEYSWTRIDALRTKGTKGGQAPSIDPQQRP